MRAYRLVLAQAAAHHLAQPRQRRFELFRVRRILAERVLVADGFRVRVLADFGIEPSAGIQPARFARQRQAPLSEALLQELLVELRQVAHLADPERMQVLLGHLADAGDLAHVERRQKRGLAARE